MNRSSAVDRQVMPKKNSKQKATSSNTIASLIPAKETVSPVPISSNPFVTSDKVFSYTYKDGKKFTSKVSTMTKPGLTVTLDNLTNKRTLELGINMELSQKSVSAVYSNKDASIRLTQVAGIHKVTENDKDTFVECKLN